MWTASTSGVFQELAVVGIAGLDAVTIAAFVEPFAVAAADRVNLGAGVFLIDRDELGPEAQADDCHADRLFARHRSLSFAPVSDFPCEDPCRIVGQSREGKHPERIGEPAWRRRPQDKKVRVAFIGTGAVTAYHHLPGLRLDPRAELVAICDTVPELLEKRRAEWNVEHATTDPEALCASDAVDAVVIATPNDTHRPIAVAAARAGKHVMCEKPLGLSAVEVREMYEAARDAGRRAHDGLHLPFRPVDAVPPPPGQVGGAGDASPFPLPALSRLARDELGLAAVPVASRRGRPVRHDDPSHRLRHRPDGPDRAGLRRGRAVRASRPDGRRQAVPSLRRRRLVVA